MYLGQNIRLLRKKRRYSQKDLADELGLSVNQVSKYEKDESQPRIETLIQIAQILNTDLSDLVLKNLAVEEANPASDPPANEEETEELLGMVNELLYKRVLQLEEEIKRTDPERAKDLGIK